MLFSNRLDLNKENLLLTFSQAFYFHSKTDMVMCQQYIDHRRIAVSWYSLSYGEAPSSALILAEVLVHLLVCFYAWMLISLSLMADVELTLTARLLCQAEAVSQPLISSDGVTGVLQSQCSHHTREEEACGCGGVQS